MTNIVTLPGRTSKPAQDAVPKFKSKIGDQADATRSNMAIAHHTHILHASHSIAEQESPTAAVEMLKDTADLIVAHYNLFPSDEKQSARLAFYKAFRRYADAVGSTLGALEQAGDFKVAIDKERAMK